MSPFALPAPARFADRETLRGQDLQWRIAACLRERIPDFPGIHIAACGSTALLRGDVRTSAEKQLCLDCCRHVPGVMRVVDELTVAVRPFSGLARFIGSHPLPFET